MDLASYNLSSPLAVRAWEKATPMKWKPWSSILPARTIECPDSASTDLFYEIQEVFLAFLGNFP